MDHVADGLRQIANEVKAPDMFRKEMDVFEHLLNQYPDFVKFLDSPFVGYVTKCLVLDRVWDSIFKAMGIKPIPEMVAFTKIVVRLRMIKDFTGINEEYDFQVNRQMDVLYAKVYVPFPLQEDTKARLKSALEKHFGKRVALYLTIDKSLIAGIKVMINGTMYELSVESLLTKIKDSLSYRKS